MFFKTCTIFILISVPLFIAKIAKSSGDNNGNNDNSIKSKTEFWLIQDTHNQSGLNNEKLAQLLTRIGPNMQASSDYHDYKDIQLEESIQAWKILHEQSKNFAQDQVQLYRPKIEKLLIDAKVSHDCKSSIDYMLNSLEELKYWAVQSK